MGIREAVHIKKMNSAVLKTFVSVLVAAGLSIALAFSVNAAGSGTRHHKDTADYCLRASDVSVGLSELSGLSRGEKERLVESCSDYAIYTWNVVYKEWGGRVSASGDFSSVNWDSAGSYEVRVSAPSLTEGVSSAISYTLTIVDDLPPEKPKYTIQVSFIDEASGLDVLDPFFLYDQEEGSSYDLTHMTENIPEGYELAEVIGDLAGNAAEDREILIMCRKLPALYTLTLTFTDQETGLALTEPLIYPDLEEGSAYDLTEEAAVIPEGYEVTEILGDLTGTLKEDLEITVVCKKTEEEPQKEEKPSSDSSSHKSGKSGSSSGSKKSSGTGSGKSSSRQSSAKTGGRSAETAQQAAQETKEQQEQQETVQETPEASVEEETKTPETKEEKGAEPAEQEEQAKEETEQETAALAASEEEEDQSDLSGALLPQSTKPERGVSPFIIATGVVESGILAVLIMLILSDLKLIRWFEEKKKR